MNADEVRLPFDDLLLPWTMKHDPEVARIILTVQAKAKQWRPSPDLAGVVIEPETRPSRRSLEYKQAQMKKRVIKAPSTDTFDTPGY